MTNPLFYAKILLFGEYGIIEDSQGLTLPYSFYKGTLKFSDLESDFEKKSNLSLEKYSNYLLDLELPEEYKLDVHSFKNDIAKGLFFDSNIPQGYGVGSSGALVAAIFEKYSFTKREPDAISKNELKDLKMIFGQLESYFHGKSSGIDPLICFMNLPILIESKGSVDKVSIPAEELGKGAIFLIDSGTIGETGPMIQIFFEKLKNEGFRKTLKEDRFPFLQIRFVSLKETPMLSSVKGLVEISIAGVTKRFEINYQLSIDKNAITLTGNHMINFSDFNLVPPKKIGKLIQAKDELAVLFTLKMEPVS